MSRALRRLACAVALLTAAPAALAAQQGEAEACRAGGAAELRLPAGDAPERVVAMDTSFRIEVEQRRWTARQAEGRAVVGVGDASPAPWHACVGAWVTMGRAEVEVQEAYGQVHIRASLEPLMRVLGRARPGTVNQPARENP